MNSLSRARGALRILDQLWNVFGSDRFVKRKKYVSTLRCTCKCPCDLLPAQAVPNSSSVRIVRILSIYWPSRNTFAIIHEILLAWTLYKFYFCGGHHIFRALTHGIFRACTKPLKVRYLTLGIYRIKKLSYSSDLRDSLYFWSSDPF